MKNDKLLKIVVVIGIIAFVGIFVFWFRGGFSKEEKTIIKPTPTPARQYEIQEKDKPLIKLVPREDGRELKLTVEKILNDVREVEYELIYFAKSEGGEFERGAGDIVSLNGQGSFERDILLGTASCTSGTCKYKYDEGVTHGKVSLRFILNDESIFGTENGFELESGVNEISLGGGNVILKSAKKLSDYWVVLEAYGLPTAFTQGEGIAYSVFGNQTAEMTVSGSKKLYVFENTWKEAGKTVKIPANLFVLE